MKKKNIFMLTVVVPTFNRSLKLKKALSLIIKNKNPKICFLILNNNSTDDSIKVIKNFIKKDKRIFLKNHKKNIGAANNFRYGFKNSKTPYVCFVSDDDILKGNYFDSCLEIFQNNKDVGLIHHEYGKKINKFSKKYIIYKKGIESAKIAFNLSTIIAGLAMRKKLINFIKYPTNKNFVYSYMSQILLITKKFRFAKIQNSAFFPLNIKKNFQESIKDGYEMQRRPFDYGIIEIWEYILKSDYDVYDKMQIMQKKIFWISKVVSLMPEKNYENFMKNYESKIGSYFKFFYIYILYKRFEFKTLILMLNKIINPLLLKFLVIELILFFKHILKKI